MPTARPMPRREGRDDRKAQRYMWQYAKFFWYTEHHTAPHLRGAKLARMIRDCSPLHLTVLSRGRRASMTEEARAEWFSYRQLYNNWLCQ
jgi:hypothetical protein